jgi:glycosyltransferase involved in cell wall biosynthesis
MRNSRPGTTSLNVLHVSPGTTAGWRRADEELRRALEELGVSVATCTSDFRWARHFRRTVLTTDLAEAAAMRRALTVALRRYEPGALIISSPQAAMLQAGSLVERPAAIRYDVPAAVNRRGAGSGLLHVLERRAFRRARLLLPIGIEPAPVHAVEGVDTPMVALPIPVETPAHTNDQRELLAITYAGNPDKKGLDLAVGAWSGAAPGEWRLAVTGIGADAGRSFLAARGIAEPPNLEWTGMLDAERYRELLSRATVYVSASRYEDYGLAQLEALATGALLVTVASEGPNQSFAYASQLNGALVSEAVSADGLARALLAAIELGPDERSDYRRAARELIQPHSREELRRRLADEVLPVLLG